MIFFPGYFREHRPLRLLSTFLLLLPCLLPTRIALIDGDADERVRYQCRKPLFLLVWVGAFCWSCAVSDGCCARRRCNGRTRGSATMALD